MICLSFLIRSRERSKADNMPASYGGGNMLLRICLAAVASFVCLLWAVCHFESRESRDPTDNLKSLVRFVRTHSSNNHEIEKQAGIKTSSLIPVSRSVPIQPQAVVEGDLRVSELFKHPPPLLSPPGTPAETNPTYKATPSSYEGDIYMDWVGDSDDFGYLNYKSLDSLLAVYPRARVTVHLIAPNGAQYYKMGNLISKHYFQKYLKYGYNVQTKIVFQTYPEKHMNSTLGAAYWNKQFALCCTSTSAADINRYRVIPVHMYFYLRLMRLYETGGVYSDFSWYHMNPVDSSISNNLEGGGESDANNSTTLLSGARIILSCYSKNSADMHTIDSHATTTTYTASEGEACMYHSSTLLTFPKHSSVLHCMLTMYNTTTSTLLRCINEDAFSDGAACVKQALDGCFASTHTANIFRETEVNGAGRAKPNDRATLWMGHASYNGDWTEPSADNVLHNYIQNNPLVVPGPFYKAKLITRTPATTSNTSIRDTEGGNSSTIPFVPYPLPLLAAVTPAEQLFIRNLNSNKVTHIPQNRSSTCAHYKYDMKLPSHMHRQASLSCAPHFVIPGYMKAGTTYLYATLSAHPLLLNTLRGVSFKETGCYGKQYLEGKGRSLTKASINGAFSDVYATLSSASDSNMNPVNISARYREALHLLATSSPRYANRMDCFPFVESHEKVRFGDGTVWYNSHKYIPRALLHDNPNMKVLFTIRNPVHRTESQHRFYYSTIVRLYTGDLNEIIRYLLLDKTNHHYDGGSLYELREQAVDILQETDPTLKALKTETLMENFQKKLPIDKKYKMLNQFIKYSIYFVPIYYWYKYIPKSNIVVVPAEVLKPNKIDTTTKLEYLYNLTTLTECNTITEMHNTATTVATTALRTLRAKYATKASLLMTQVEDENVRTERQAKLDTEQAQQEAKIKKIQDKALNQAYMVHQYNRLFRFLELPEMTSIADADSHETGDKFVLPEHKLSDTSRALLEHYFEPFNRLLEDYLGGSVGYSS